MATKGASTILKSPLVYKGWRLNHVEVIESDDRFLFDAEVKLKLAHSDCEEILDGILSDFPPEVIMQRYGMFSGLLDIVGSIITLHENELVIGALNPFSALSWLERFMSKFSQALNTQLEGSLSCTLPLSMMRKEQGHQKSVSSNLTAEMALAMYTMRYPLMGPSSSPRVQPNSDPFSDASSSASPPPSCSGLAFAACAASLPLLKAKNSSLSTAVLKLLQVALPFIVEPLAALYEAVSPAVSERAEESPFQVAAVCSDDAAGGTELPGSAAREAREISVGRLQHLFNRIEQLIVCLELSPLQKIALKDAAAADVASDNEVSYFLFVASLVETISVCPVPWVASPESDDATKGSTLSVGRHTSALLRLLCLEFESGSGGQSINDKHLTGSKYSHIKKILKRVDPSTEKQIGIAHELRDSVEAIRSFVQADLNSNFMNVFPSNELRVEMTQASYLDWQLTNCWSVVDTILVLQERSDAFVSSEDPERGTDTMVDILNNLRLPDLGIAVAMLYVSASIENEANRLSRATALLSTLLAQSFAPVARDHCVRALLSCLTLSYSSSEADTAAAAAPLKAPLLLLLAQHFKTDILSSKQKESVLLVAIQNLASPQMFSSLLQFCVFDRKDGTQALSTNAVSLLDILAKFVLKYVDISEEWASALPPLKLFAWQQQDETRDRFSAGQAEALNALTLFIEDMCLSSASPCLRAASTPPHEPVPSITHEQCLILGLFHTQNSIRCLSAAVAFRDMDLLPRHENAFAGQQDSGGIDIEITDPLVDMDFKAIIDVFSSHDTDPTDSRLLDISSATAMAKIRKTRDRMLSTVYNHADVRKLLDICLGTDTTSEYRIRVAACAQAREMLRDPSLLQTIDPDFCCAVAAACSREIDGAAWHALSPTGDCADKFSFLLEAAELLKYLLLTVPATRKTASLHCAVPSPQFSDADSGAHSTSILGVEVASKKTSPSLKKKMSNFVWTTGSIISLRPLVKALLLPLNRFPDATDASNAIPVAGLSGVTGLGLSRVQRRARVVAAQILFIHAFDSSQWFPSTIAAPRPAEPTEDISIWKNLLPSIKFNSVGSTVDGVIVPSFLARMFVYPVGVATVDTQNKYTSSPASSSPEALKRGGRIASILAGSDTHDFLFSADTLDLLRVWDRRVHFRIRDYSISEEEEEEERKNRQFVPSVEILKLVLNISRSSDASSNCVGSTSLRQLQAIAVQRVTALSRSSSHASYRSAVASALALVVSIPQGAFATELIEADIQDGFKKILEALPNTEQDYKTLSRALNLIERLLRERKNEALARLCVDSLSTVLSPLLSPFGADASSSPSLPSPTAAAASVPRPHKVLAVVASLRVLLTVYISIDGAVGMMPSPNSDRLVLLLRKISGLLVSEFAPSHVRALAAQVADAVVRAAPWVLTAVAGVGESCISNSNSVLGDLVACVKLLRVPDSFKGSGVMLGAARALCVSVHNLNSQNQTPGQNSPLAYLNQHGLDANSKWLVRLCYDRRNAVRLLALQLIHSLRPLPSSSRLSSLAADDIMDHADHILRDSSECVAVRESAMLLCLDAFQRSMHTKRAPAVCEGEREGLDEADSGTTKAELLLSKLLLSISDVLRCDGLATSARAIHSALGTVLTVLRDCKRVVSSDDNERSGRPGVLAIDQVIVVFRTCKILPLIVELLNPRTLKALRASALARASLRWTEDHLRFISSETGNNAAPLIAVGSTAHSSSGYSRDSVSVGDVDLASPLVGLPSDTINTGDSNHAVSGYCYIVSAQFARQEDDLFESQGLVSRILIELVCLYRSAQLSSSPPRSQHSQGGDVGRLDDDILAQSVRYTWLLPNLITCLTSSISTHWSHRFKPSPSEGNESIFSDDLSWGGSGSTCDRALAAHMTLLASIIEQDISNSRSGAATLVSDLVTGGGGTVIPLAISRSALLQLEYVLRTIQSCSPTPTNNAFEEPIVEPSAGRLLSASTHLLVVVAECPVWRQNAGFCYSTNEPSSSASAGDSGIHHIAAGVVRCLLSLRMTLSAAISRRIHFFTGAQGGTSRALSLQSYFSSIRAAQSLLARVDFTLAILFRHSQAAKEVALYQCDTNNISTHAQEPSPLLVSCASTVKSVVQMLQAQKPSTSLARPTSSTGPSPSKDTIKKLKDNRWRNKVRGFTVSNSLAATVGVRGKGYSVKASPPTTTSSSNNNNNNDINSNNKTAAHTCDGTMELPQSCRLLLWSVLTLLQAWLLDYPDAQESACAVGLHEHLSTLLSFSCRWASTVSIANASSHSAYSDFNVDSDSLYGTGLWVPTPDQVAAAAASALASLSFGSAVAKYFLSTARETNIAMSGGSVDGRGGLLHQLLSVGLSHGTAKPLRWLSLNLLTGLIANGGGSRAHKSVFIGVLENIILGILRKPAAGTKGAAFSRGDGEHLPGDNASGTSALLCHALEAWSCCVSEAGEAAATSIPSIPSALHPPDSALGSKHNPISVAGGGNNTSFPALLQWVYEAKIQSSTAHDTDKTSIMTEAVAVALSRAIGRMAFTTTVSEEVVMQNMSLGYTARTRRVLANATCETSVDLLLDTIARFPQHSAASTSASAAVWVVTHVSESARSVVKIMLKERPQVAATLLARLGDTAYTASLLNEGGVADAHNPEDCTDEGVDVPAYEAPRNARRNWDRALEDDGPPAASARMIGITGAGVGAERIDRALASLLLA